MKFLLVKVNGRDWLRLMLKVRSGRRWMPELQNEFPSPATQFDVKNNHLSLHSVLNPSAVAHMKQ